MIVAALAGVVVSGGAAAAAVGGGPGSPPTNAPATSTTLPPVPAVALAYTDGQPPQTLLSKALALSALGVGNRALVTAVTATQRKLDADALTARHFGSEAATARARAAGAATAAARAGAQFSSMAGAVEQAVVYLYTAGPSSISVSPNAGRAALYAQDYAESTIGPYGILARWQAVSSERARALGTARHEADVAEAAAAKAAKALAAEQKELQQMKAELASVTGAAAAAVAADHFSLAVQAGKELLSASSLEFTPRSPLPPPVSTTNVALTWAFAELGKQYVWGATGPDTFDCSGLTQFVWKAAGVSIPRVASDQDAWSIPVPLSQLLPGDLVFFGTTDIHHVGLYIGDGLMINAPHTGTVVQVSSIWWSDLAGFGRVHYPGTPVPSHNVPTPKQPAPAVVIPVSGPVPSQTRPPAGSKPKAGDTMPIRLSTPASSTPPDPTSTTSEPSTTTSTTLADGNGGTTSTSSTSLGPVIGVQDGGTADSTTTMTSTLSSVP